MLTLKLGIVVHGLDLLEEEVLGLVSLELEGRSEEVVLGRESHCRDVNLGGDFETEEAALLSLNLNVVDEEFLDLIFRDNLLIIALNAFLSGPLLQDWLIRNNNGN